MQKKTETNSEIRSLGFSGVKWASIGRFSSQGISFVLGLILARLLLPSDYGMLGMLGVFTAFTGSFIDCGFGSALIRKLNRTEIDCSTVFYYNLATSLLVYGILFCSAPFIADFYKQPLLTDVTRIACLTIPIGAFCSVHSNILYCQLRFKDIAVGNILATILSGSVGLLLAYNDYGVWALVCQGIVASLVNCGYLWRVSSWKPLWVFSMNSFKELFGYGSKLMLSGWLNTMYAQLSPLIIGKFYSSASLGYYTRAQSYVNFPSDNIMGVLQQVVFPILSRLQNEDDRLIEIYRKYIRICAAFIFGGMAILAALAKPMVVFLLTDKWLPCVPIMMVLCFSSMFSFVNTINLSLLQVKGRSDLFLKLEVVKKIISITMILFSASWGIMAMCWAMVIYTQIAIFINTYYTGKLFHVGYWEQLTDFLPYLFLALLANVPAYLLTYSSLSAGLQMILGGLMSLFIYLLLLKIKQDEMYLMIRHMLGDFYKNRIKKNQERMENNA